MGPRRVKPFCRVLSTSEEPTLEQLLSLYPRDYDDRRKLLRICDLRPGSVASFRGQVIGEPRDRKTASGKTVTQVPFSDGTGRVLLSWFNQPYIKKRLRVGDRYFVSGKAEAFGGDFTVSHPDLELAGDGAALSGGRIVPIYPLTEGLLQPTVREALWQAVRSGSPLLSDILPREIREKHRLFSISEAIENIHFPTTPQALNEARRRLKFEELFLLQVFLAQRRREKQVRPAPKMVIDVPIAVEIRRMVPFEPTGAQKQAVREIFRDLVRPVPMNRLLQGDVGSGKTIVAAIAVVAVVRNGRQVALMAPTELLAEQHASTLRRLLEPLGIRVGLLTGALSARDREAMLEAIRTGSVDVVAGTHALIQDVVRFSRLGLTIVDEQHRFGVAQRHRMQQQGASGEEPHVLVMTATPIPRTLSLTVYGHLDVSIINEMPPGRTPIRTVWKSHRQRPEVYEFVREQAAAGRQAYVVCPLVENSEKLDAVSATGWYEYLQYDLLRDLRVGLLHGKARPGEKEAVMEQFRAGEIQVLTSTTVIEVGLDVPNATVMVIEDANRFGLAQLHQLRGRVGRGAYDGHCFLVSDETYNPDAVVPGDLFGEEAPDEASVGRQRMRALVELSDGFKIAEEDYRLRGVGIYFGSEQHGRSRLRIADLQKDLELLQIARDEAFALIERDPQLQQPSCATLRENLVRLDFLYQIDEDYSTVA